MKSKGFPGASQMGRTVVLATLVGWCGVTCPAGSAQSAIDPALNPTLRLANQEVFLSWFGSNSVPYQVESSSDLSAWTNCSLVVTGRGAVLSVAQPIAGQSGGFFRVKRLPPVDPRPAGLHATSAQFDATSAAFDPTTGVLTIFGDDLDNVVVVKRNAAGALRINNGAVPISGGVPTVANTVLIQIFGRAGHDQLSLDESNGELPRAQLFGEVGDDKLTGGSGADLLDGGPGSDTLLGRAGVDRLLGGDDNDTVTGGDGDDQAELGTGNDRFIWNPGDDTDLVEGGNDIDTIEVNGGDGAETFTTTANGTRVRFDRLNPAPFFLDIGTCENLVVNANGGNDTFSATGNLAA
ncbi:MAG: hypothetical protein L0Z50_04560, partial [Verrucomicrobiales bacterium]|nr:hypothetical protein [Verrucomicrobiales bacterium]